MTEIEDFGSYLKAERELRGVPLDEVSATTRINIRFLMALENNQFDDLPGEVFIKGYIRSISKVIGSDENEMLSTYAEIRNKTSPKPKDINPKVENNNSTDKSFIFRLGLIILFLVGIGWGVTILVKPLTSDIKPLEPAIDESDQNQIKKLTDLTTETKDDLNSSKKLIEQSNVLNEKPKIKNELEKLPDNLPRKSIQSTENLSVIEDSESTSTVQDDMPLKLVIKVKDNVWFNIRVDESREEAFIFPKSTEKIFFGKDNFTIAIGNRNAVDIELNDNNLSLPEGDENNVIQEFTINSQMIE